MVCDARAYYFQIFIRILADSYLIRKSSRQMIVFSVSACTFHLPTVCTGTKHLHCHHQIGFQNESQENGMQREKKFATVTPFRVCVTVYRKRISSVLRSA